MFLKKVALKGAMLALLGTALSTGTAAYAAECGPEGASVRILGADFPAIQAVTGTAEANCAANASDLTVTLREQPRDIMNQALTPNPAEYTSVVVANATLAQLMADDLVRPLNEYVEKYGQNIKPNQLITIDGDVMAVAFMANAQHLFVRKDILEQAGVEGIPSTVEEILDAAEKIRAAGIMEHPIVMNVKVGWNVGELFNLFFFANGGELFKPGTAEPNVNTPEGVATLNTIKSLLEYAHPDHLSHASNETQGLWKAGQAAIGMMWGSRGGPILDPDGAVEGVTENTVLAPAPTVGGGSVPAATLWWDGISIAKNVPDADAEATFAALASALSPEMVAEHNDDAVWLLEGYQPGPAAVGVSATAQAGARPYPMVPYVNLMHNAMGSELTDFYLGTETAEEALADAEAAYRSAAREAGFLN